MYKHNVQYYETDKMGVTHHSNYIRWMEEARIYFLQDAGISYDGLEEMGIISPVIGCDCKYKKTSTYPDVISIDCAVEEFNGVKLKLRYTMVNENGELVAEGHTEHCFLNQKGYPVRMKKECPQYYDQLMVWKEASKIEEK